MTTLRKRMQNKTPLIPLRYRLQIVVFAWVVCALLVLALGGSAAEVGATAVIFVASYLIGELIP